MAEFAGFISQAPDGRPACKYLQTIHIAGSKIRPLTFRDFSSRSRRLKGLHFIFIFKDWISIRRLDFTGSSRYSIPNSFAYFMVPLTGGADSSSLIAMKFSLGTSKGGRMPNVSAGTYPENG
jgi:hypothetical protein